MPVVDKNIPTIGIEEEFQIVSKENADLASGYYQIADIASDEIKRRIKPETYPCFLETNTHICPDIETAFKQTMSLRASLAALTEKNDMAIIAAGTHPYGKWYEHELLSTPRHKEIGDVLQDAFRSRMTFGLHVHIGIEDKALRIHVMNQARSYLPHILALSTNSPFWMGRPTGWMSYRAMNWNPAPWVGIPDPFLSVDDYYRFRDLLFNSDAVKRTFHLWWDIKSHDTYPTLEIRIADMPTYHYDMISIVALIQSLIKKLLWLSEHGQSVPVLSTPLINENKWRAARWGLAGVLRDWRNGTEISTVDAINDMLTFVRDVEDELGTGRYLAHIQSMLEPGYVSGAYLQTQTFEQHQNTEAVAHMLVRETLKGINMSTAII